jgi:radical SAM protein with 4Fe4S-binding SPASM domain
MAQKIVSANWIPPELKDVHFRQRGESWLCLNSTVPAWFVATQVGILLLKLSNGKRSLGQIHQLLITHDVLFSLTSIIEFFNKVIASGFYGSSVDEEILWGDRNLTAMHLHLTNRCNLQCTYCFRESSPKIPIHHTSEHFCEMLEYIKPFTSKAMTVTFTGGEPTLFPEFEEVVRTSTQLGYKNELLTNGTRITAKLADFIVQHFHHTKISLDGPNEAIHSLTRGNGNFQLALRGIRELADKGANLTVQVTVSKSNLESCQEIKTLLEGVEIKFTPLMPMGRGDTLDKEFIDNEAFLGLSRGLERVTEGKLKTSLRPGVRMRRCHAGISNISVADTGDVYPCHLFHYERFKFGNIFTDSFGDIFWGSKIKQYVKSMDVEENNSICRSCEVRFLCAGGCKANALHATGDHQGVDLYCSYLKESIIDQLFNSCGVDYSSSVVPETQSV